MKKTKLIKSLGALAALTAPMTTVLMTTTGCSGKNYAELISEMKDECIQTFMHICRNVHRNVWNEGEAAKYIKSQMHTILAKSEPDGYDKWSELNAYKRVIKSERSKLEDGHDYGEYGNMWYDIPASSGFEKAPKIILQCHMDSQMAFKNDAAHVLWAKTPEEGGCTEPEFSNTDEVMKSKSGNTSLGSDGGFGIAALITIAKYRNRFNHPGLRLLFTAGESEAIAKYKDQTTNVEYPEYAAGFSLLEYDQKGTIPAGEKEGFHVGSKPFGDYDGEYKYIISETGVIKNNIFVSSSGIHECSLHTPKTLESYNTLNEDESIPKQAHAKDGNKISWNTQKTLPWETTSRKWIEIKVSNFQGGTSSTYIGKGQGSAVRFLYKILFCGDTDMQLINSHSEPDNAYTISTDASVQLATFYNVDIWKKKIESILPSFKTLWPNEDWNKIINSISIKELQPTAEMPQPVHAMSAQQTRDLIKMVATELYFGPINYFEDGTVKTSENIGPCCLDIHESGIDNQTTFELNFHVVERSSEIDQLYIFQELTHSILADGFDAWFQDDTWQEKLVTHVADPVWKAPDKENPNRLATAFQQAYNNFKIRNRIANEHAWLEIACAPTIYENVGFTTVPNCVMIGVQVEKNHAIDEILYTDTIASVLETTVYVLENANTIIPK